MLSSFFCLLFTGARAARTGRHAIARHPKIGVEEGFDVGRVDPAAREARRRGRQGVRRDAQGMSRRRRRRTPTPPEAATAWVARRVSLSSMSRKSCSITTRRMCV